MIDKTKEMLKSVTHKNNENTKDGSDALTKESPIENKESLNENEEDIFGINNRREGKRREKLFDFIGKEKAQLTKQFEELRSSTLSEMERSKSLLETLKTMKGIEKTGDTDESSELDMSISALEEGVQKFQLQLE